MKNQDKKFYTKWWFWVIAAIVFLGVLGLVVPSNCEECEICESCEECEVCEVCEICPETEQEAPYTKDWYYKTSFNGVSDKTTDTFEIKGNKFRLTYTINPANEYSLFYLYVYEEGDNIYMDSISLDSGTDTSIVYDGPGTYYLDVIAANLDSWEVEVEDYY